MNILRLKNFRCLEDTGDIEIRPLTFLVGANSSGKSSFLKFFPLLKQSVRVRKKGVFLWNYHDVDMRDFRNTVREGANSICVDFVIGSLPLRGRAHIPSGREVQGMRVSIEIEALGEHYDFMRRISLHYQGQQIEISFKPDGETNVFVNGKCMNELYPLESIIMAGQGTGIIPVFWFNSEKDISGHPEYNFAAMRKVVQDHFSSAQLAAARIRSALNMVLFSKKELEDYIKEEWSIKLKKSDIDSLNNLMLYQNVGDILFSLNDCISEYANSIEYIRPLRATIDRYYRFQNYAIDEIDSNGENLAMFLYNLMPSQKSRLDLWTLRMFGFKILVNAHEGHVELGISEGENGLFHNLVDVGFGYTQLLPIIVLIWKAVYMRPSRGIVSRKTAKKIIVIEQPELHLHPRMQMLFADMLVKVLQTTEKGKFKFIIETHSETIINRVGELISLENKFSQDDVNVVLFQKGEQGSIVTIASYDEDGYLTNWPVGFFSGYAD